MDVPYHRFNQSPFQQHGPNPSLEGTLTREQLFLSELPMIERVIAWVCARRSLRGADGEDFASTVKLRLIEDDYEILGRFKGRSSLKTYVTAVVNHLYLDYQTQRFGKWRPSAEARRLGQVALRLESLLHRDGLSFEEASGVLLTDSRLAESREALYELSLKLPPRSQRMAGSSRNGEPADGPNGSSTIEQSERQVLARRILLILRRALLRLPARDRLLLRLHLEAGLSLANVARSLGEDQKALYRRRDALVKRLREDLEAEGIHGRDAQELLSTHDWEGDLDGHEVGGSFQEEARPRPSALDGRTDRREGEP